MIRKILFIVLVFVAMPACSDCNVTEGRYISTGGSEESISLELLTNKKLVLEYKSWKPGHYESSNVVKTKGEWSCEKNQITLKINSKKNIAKLIIIGENPLGINTNTKALSFSKNIESEINYLANETLYPESAIVN